MTPTVIPHRSTRVRWLSLAAAAVLVLAACGGDADDPATEPTDAAPGSTTTASDSGDAATTTVAADATTTTAGGGDGSAGGKYAIVTLGGETYEADFVETFSQCISMGGAIGAVAPIAGLEDASLDLSIPPQGWETSGEEWEPPSVGVDLGEDANGVPIDWRASADVVETFPQLEGKSQVDSVTYDGTTISGTATFIDFFQAQLFVTGQVDEPQPVMGTFEISCG